MLVYAYCRYLRSVLRIEAACRSDLAFRAMCADLVPDDIAIARFRSDHTEAIRAVFIDVLELCARAGLASLGTIAIDGTKIATDAALDAPSRPSPPRSTPTWPRPGGPTRPRPAARPGRRAPRRAGPWSRLARLRSALGEIEAEREARRAAEAEKSRRLADGAAAGKRPRGATPTDPAQALPGQRPTSPPSRSAGTRQRPRSPSWRPPLHWERRPRAPP